MTRFEESQFEWKGYIFPTSVIDFSLSEDAKVATYPYAGRNGAEHERVLDYRKFSLRGVFAYNYRKDDLSIAAAPTPIEHVKKLQELNDNSPGIFHHKQFGRYNCILKSLKITQNGSDGDWFEGEFRQNFEFDMEFWEHISPSEDSLVNSLELLAAAPNPKPPNAFYVNRVDYKTSQELYEAIKNGDIVPGTHEELNKDWLAYDFNLRQAAYYKWLEFQKTGQETVSTETSRYTYYTVQPGDWALKIAEDFGVSVEDLYTSNKDRVVRDVEKSGEGQEWKTPRRLWPGDRLIIPTDREVGFSNSVPFARSNDESNANIQGLEVVRPTSDAQKDLTYSTNTPPAPYGVPTEGSLSSPDPLLDPNWPPGSPITLPDDNLTNNLYG